MRLISTSTPPCRWTRFGVFTEAATALGVAREEARQRDPSHTVLSEPRSVRSSVAGRTSHKISKLPSAITPIPGVFRCKLPFIPHFQALITVVLVIRTPVVDEDWIYA